MTTRMTGVELTPNVKTYDSDYVKFQTRTFHRKFGKLHLRYPGGHPRFMAKGSGVQ